MADDAVDIRVSIGWHTVRWRASHVTPGQSATDTTGRGDSRSWIAPQAQAPGSGAAVIRARHYSPRTEEAYVHWIIVVILYGAGLRIQDCLALRVKDIDFDRHQIVVRRGKGQKDVRTMLPVAVRDRLRVHVEEVKRQHERDLARGVGRAVLPFALDRKFNLCAHGAFGRMDTRAARAYPFCSRVN